MNRWQRRHLPPEMVREVLMDKSNEGTPAPEPQPEMSSGPAVLCQVVVQFKEDGDINLLPSGNMRPSFFWAFARFAEQIGDAIFQGEAQAAAKEREQKDPRSGIVIPRRRR